MLYNFVCFIFVFLFCFFQAKDGMRNLVRSRGLGDVYKRQVEEGLIDPAAFIQVGIRGSLYFPDDLNVARRLGIRVLTIDDLSLIHI